MKVFAKALERILEKADIKVNGNRPWDIRLRDLNYFDRLESYDTTGNVMHSMSWSANCFKVVSWMPIARINKTCGIGACLSFFHPTMSKAVSGILAFIMILETAFTNRCWIL